MSKDVIAQDPTIPEIYNRRVKATHLDEKGVHVEFHECSYFIETGKYKEAPPIPSSKTCPVKVSNEDPA